MRQILPLLVLYCSCAPSAPEYVVIKGGFGDAWKNKVLSGEYRRVSNPSKYNVRSSTNGRPVYEKRRKNEYPMFIRYETQDKQWYFQAKEHLPTRTNYAHISCKQNTLSPVDCQITRCQTWGESAWVNCSAVTMRNGGDETRQRDISEQQIQRQLSSGSEFPKIISVEGEFGDRWKDSVLLGPYQLKEDLDVKNTGNRPVYQKLDNTDFYLNYYAPFNEWGFRSKEVLGQRRSYAYIKPIMETYNPTQINSVEFKCQVYADDGEGKYTWASCSNKIDGTPKISIVSSYWPGLILPKIIPPKIVAKTERITTTTKTTPTLKTSANNLKPDETHTYDDAYDFDNISVDDSQEIIYTKDISEIRQKEKYTKLLFDASYSDAKSYCENFPNTLLADFNGLESDIDQRWLITYEPWSNVRKYNGRWRDGNNRIPGNTYDVREVKPWHVCAYFKNGHLYSEDCRIGIHKVVCEFNP